MMLNDFLHVEQGVEIFHQVLFSADSSAARRLRGKVAWAALNGAAQRFPAATTRVAGNQGGSRKIRHCYSFSFLKLHITWHGI